MTPERVAAAARYLGIDAADFGTASRPLDLDGLERDIARARAALDEGAAATARFLAFDVSPLDLREST